MREDSAFKLVIALGHTFKPGQHQAKNALGEI